MKVLVVNNMVPNIRGGAEELADHLVANLRLAGHDAELLRIPFRWDPAEKIIDEMLMCRGFRLINVDRVIALKFPAYLVPFDNKVFWLLHQFRQAYDLFDAGQSHIPSNEEGNALREAIMEADNMAFGRARAIHCVGREVQKRLQQYNGVRSDVLRAPLNDEALFFNREYGDYIFAGGRINAGKRQHLLVEAMAKAGSQVRLVIAGPPDSPADALRIEALVAEHGLQDRVTLEFGFLPRSRIADYVNGALACAYLPFEEDSYGYVTMEACQAKKAVITVDDSGDVLELVRDGQTGFVCSPDAEGVARALDLAWEDRERTQAIGRAAHATWVAMDINWPATVARLLA